ncbi:kelch-like protein 20 [Sitodiplosis mosellana]|uniref:kelch-like protein 20 n=1 Tax=Sitodiplosis mosellana TaxID=263140 RepID=UPI002444A6BF|nr:kelch-like protein 20 [Sitodiplosis mosellana]
MASNDYECTSQVFSDIGNGLYLNPELADVNFIFESNDNHVERVPAHKILLMAASDVFRVMFNGQWKEKDEVEIADTSVSVFKEFLQFFYIDRVKLTVANINVVFKLGHKYNVTKCMTVCKKFMVNTLTNDSILQRYALAIQFDQDDLVNVLEKLIGINTKPILESAEFLKCSRSVVSGILNIDVLSCTEVELFEACMNWVKANANQSQLSRKLVKSHLGNLFRYLRFGSMSINEFATVTSSHREIFSFDEYTDIIQMIGSKQHKSKFFNGIRSKRELKINDAANDEKRQAEIICNRKILSSQNQRARTKDTTTFSSTDPLLLHTIHLPKIIGHDGKKYHSPQMKIAIEEIPHSAISTEKVLLYEGQTNLTTNSGCERFDKPILIKPGSTYRIHMEQLPLGIYYSKLLKEKVEIKSGITIDFKSTKDDDDDDDPNGSCGLIQKLYFDPVWPLVP